MSFQAVVQKRGKIYDLPTIPKGIDCFVGKNGVLKCVLYMPDVIDSEDLRIFSLAFRYPPPPCIFS